MEMEYRPRSDWRGYYDSDRRPIQNAEPARPASGAINELGAPDYADDVEADR